MGYWEILCNCGVFYRIEAPIVPSLIPAKCPGCLWLEQFSAAKRDFYLEWLEEDFKSRAE